MSSSTPPSSSTVTIAVEGCAHGELDGIYASLLATQERLGCKVDLLICCGDFQAVRNLVDLHSMACPVKFLSMNTFYKYYSGEKVAPVPTLFIGGNHEASNHLQELYHGGWVAPNIYYLGNSGVVRFGGLRIAGISGIFKSGDYRKGVYEQIPYDRSTTRSVFHTREIDAFKLAQVSGAVDIGLSHDWPRGVAPYGDTQSLLRKKPFFREEIERGELGSIPAEFLLQHLRPSFWFSAHLHVKFAALLPHAPRPGDKLLNQPSATAHPALEGAATETRTAVPAGLEDENEIDLDDEDLQHDEGVCEPDGAAGCCDSTDHAQAGQAVLSAPADPSQGHPPTPVLVAGRPLPLATKFLALDKCQHRRHFLQVLEIPCRSDDAACVTSGVMSQTAIDEDDNEIDLEAAEADAPESEKSTTEAAKNDRVKPSSLELCYDAEWLAILQKTHSLLTRQVRAPPLPARSFRPSQEEVAAVAARAAAYLNNPAGVPPLRIPHNFAATAPAYSPHGPSSSIKVRPPAQDFLAARRGSPQTDSFLAMLGLPHAVTIPYVKPAVTVPASRSGIGTNAAPSPKSASTREFQGLVPIQVMMQAGNNTQVIQQPQNDITNGGSDDENEIDLDEL